MCRESLLAYKPKPTSNDRVPLVVTYHHKLHDLPTIVRRNYNNMIRKHPTMKDVFPQPPVVSFRKCNNLANKLIRADHNNKKSQKPHPPTTVKTRSIIDSFMNNSGSITNTKANITIPIEGGKATQDHVIYAVRCTKHDTISVGHTTIPLNGRINLHRSDITNYPKSCELVEHFATHDCDFSKDIEVSILEKVKGSTAHMLLMEDKWITRLNTRAPNGLNVRLSTFGYCFYTLF